MSQIEWRLHYATKKHNPIYCVYPKKYLLIKKNLHYYYAEWVVARICIGQLDLARPIFLYAQVHILIYFPEKGAWFRRLGAITPFVGFGPQTTLDGK